MGVKHRVLLLGKVTRFEGITSIRLIDNDETVSLEDGDEFITLMAPYNPSKEIPENTNQPGTTE